MTILDLSKWQGSVSRNAFGQIKADGISRVIHKAGGSNAGIYTDSDYVANTAAARAAGLPLGHYWFNGYGTPTSDAQYFVSHLSSYQPGDWLILDVESFSSTTAMWTPDMVLAFAKYVKQVLGVTIVVYMSASVTRPFDWSAVVAFGVQLWVAAYQPSAPSVAYWKTWIAWQFTSSGRVPGIAGNVDLSHEGTAATAVVQQTGPKGVEVLLLHNTAQGDPGYNQYWAIFEGDGYEEQLPNLAYAQMYCARYGVPITDVGAGEMGWWHDRVAAAAEKLAANVWALQLNGANGSHAAGDRLIGADLKSGTATATLPPTLATDIATAIQPHISTSVTDGLHKVGSAFNAA